MKSEPIIKKRHNNNNKIITKMQSRCFRWSLACHISMHLSQMLTLQKLFLYFFIAIYFIKSQCCKNGFEFEVLDELWHKVSPQTLNIHVCCMYSCIHVKKKYIFHFFSKSSSFSLSFSPSLACTYLNNAWDLVLLALPLYVCLFKINCFMYSPIVSRFG